MHSAYGYWMGMAALLLIATNINASEKLMKTVTVNGQGSAGAAPDMAVFETGVVTEASNASEALTKNNAALAEVLALLKELKIADKDIQTAHLDVGPQYSSQRNRDENQPRIVGYRASNRLRVKVRNLPQLGEILDAVVRKGSNQIAGIRFDIDDKTGILDQARNRAMRDAERRAELYAHAAGATIGPVVSIRESGTAPPPSPMRMARAMEASAAPIASGELELSARVEVTYELVAE